MFNINEICYFVFFFKVELKLTKFSETFVFNVKTEVLSVLYNV